MRGRENEIRAAIKDAIELMDEACKCYLYKKTHTAVPETLKELGVFQKAEDLIRQYGSPSAKQFLRVANSERVLGGAFRDVFNKSASIVGFLATLDASGSLEDDVKIELEYLENISIKTDHCYNSFMICLDDWLYLLDISQTEIREYLPETVDGSPFDRAKTFLQFLAVMQEYMLPRLKKDLEIISGRPLVTNIDQESKNKLMLGKDGFIGLPGPRQ